MFEALARGSVMDKKERLKLNNNVFEPSMNCNCFTDVHHVL